MGDMNQVFRDALVSNIKKVLTDSDVAQAIENPSSRGLAHEIFVTNLLKPYINPTVSICTGFVTDYNVRQSNQIDIILFDREIIPPLSSL